MEDCLAQRWIAKDLDNTNGKIYTVIDSAFALNRVSDSNPNCTIHHAANNITIEGLGGMWQNKSEGESSHYGINGTQVGQYVRESDIAITDKDYNSHKRSVTIETANSTLAPNWEVSDASLEILIKLVADIAIRNNLGELKLPVQNANGEWVEVEGTNITWHSMYAPTVCPGPYLLSKMKVIVDGANAINGSGNIGDGESGSSDGYTSEEISNALDAKIKFKQDFISLNNITNINIDENVFEFEHEQRALNENFLITTKYELNETFSALSSNVDSVDYNLGVDGSTGAGTTNDILGIESTLAQIGSSQIDEMIQVTQSIIREFPGGEVKYGYELTATGLSIELVYNVDLLPGSKDIGFKVSFKLITTVTPIPKPDGSVEYSFARIPLEGFEMEFAIILILILGAAVAVSNPISISALLIKIPKLASPIIMAPALAVVNEYEQE